MFKIKTGVLLGAALLSACASNAKVAKPEPLRQIAEAEVVGKKLWAESMAAPRDLNGLRPLLAAGRVFVADAAGRVQSISANGELQWSVKTKARLSAGPVLADGALLLGTLDGEVLALEAGDGSERWRSQLSSEVVTQPAAADDLVVVRSGDGRVYGLAAEDGARRWTLNRSVPALTLRGGAPLLLDYARVYVGMDNGRVLAVNRSNGEPVWEEAVSVPAGRTEIERIVDVDADLLLVDGVLFAASYGGDLVAFEAASGRALWRRSMASYSGMSLDAQCLYVTDVDAVVWCLDPRNGAALWEQNQLMHRQLSAPLAYKGNVLVADFDGYVHALSAASGKIIGRMRSGSDAVVVPMQSADGQVYLLNRGGRLQVLDWQPIEATE